MLALMLFTSFRSVGSEYTASPCVSLPCSASFMVPIADERMELRSIVRSSMVMGYAAMVSFCVF